METPEAWISTATPGEGHQDHLTHSLIDWNPKRDQAIHGFLRTNPSRLVLVVLAQPTETHSFRRVQGFADAKGTLLPMINAYLWIGSSSGPRQKRDC